MKPPKMIDCGSIKFFYLIEPIETREAYNTRFYAYTDRYNEKYWLPEKEIEGGIGWITDRTWDFIKTL